MLILQAGSAIAARQNSKLIPIALLIIAALVVFLVLRQLLIYLLKRMKEEQGSVPKKLDSKLLKANGERLGLSNDEIVFLDALCRSSKITDLPLLADTGRCISEQFKTMYEYICIREADTAKGEAQKLQLFTIIHKIENGKRALSMVTSSTAFPSGLPVSYTDEAGVSFPAAIIENTDTEMILSIAQKKDGTKIKPPPLSKIELTIQLKSGIAYIISPRIIRYQQRREYEEMVVTHTKDIIPILQRRFRRVQTALPCTFRSLKVSMEKDSKQYHPQGAEYPGTINDISAGGCRLRTMLPIKEGQYIQIVIQLGREQIDSIVGIVVRLKQDTDMKNSLLHIRFIRMAKKARNVVFSLVYNYRENLKISHLN